MKLLHIDSSILGEGSVSRTLSADIVAAQRASHNGLEIVYRDLAAAPVQHLTAAHVGAFRGVLPDDSAVREDIATGQTMLDEFLAADIVVIGAPMYNFGIPSQLKAWIDRLAVAGKTFRYTANGPEGLAGAKKVIVASSRGGVYGADGPMAAFEHQESYLRAVFGFFGVTELSFVRAEGLALGADAREKAIATARGELVRLAA